MQAFKQEKLKLKSLVLKELNKLLLQKGFNLKVEDLRLSLKPQYEIYLVKDLTSGQVFLEDCPTDSFRKEIIDFLKKSDLIGLFIETSL